MRKFTVTYNGRTPGKPVGLVTGMLTIEATDALGAIHKAYRELESDPEVCETDWAAMNFDIQPEGN
jgi:hypothetical protein